jgi:DNA replication protein DnaC
MELKQHLVPQLKQLRLSGILDTLDARSRQAIEEHWTYADFLERLLEDEVERRQQKQLSLRVRRAALASDKTLETFDFTFNPTVNRQRLHDLATCNFIRDKRNVLLCGPTGVGKSHLAQALAHAACRAGFDVVFTNAHTMLRHLNAGRADDTYDRRLSSYVRPDLLVIDDFGLKPLVSPAPEDLYDVINERYEKGSILITSNRAPAEWASWFADPLLASAGLDRLAHNAHVLVITGPSYRARGRQQLEQEVTLSAVTANSN